MADTQPAPHPATEPIPAREGSVPQAQEAILSLLPPEEEKPEEEKVEPTEVEESQPEEEDESFEEEEEEEASEEEDESESADEEDEEELYAVTVDGEEVGVNLDELMRGYSRQSDYTKKTQQIAEEKKQMEALRNQWQNEISHAQSERNQYVEALNQVVQQSMSGLEEYAGFDWATLKEEDPLEYVTKRDEFREKKERIQGMQQEQARLQHQQQAEMKQAYTQAVHQEVQKLSEIIPEWSDPESRKKMSSNIKEYALSSGYTQEEINSLIDHRSVIVLDKARKYDEMQKANPKAKKLKNKPKVVRSGSGTTKRDSLRSKRNDQMKRLQGSGHVRDASTLLEDFVDI